MFEAAWSTFETLRSEYPLVNLVFSMGLSFLFLCLGGVPNTQWAKEVGIVRDEQGYLVTGPDLRKFGPVIESWKLNREPYYLETSMPGVFAAGDVRHGSIERVASAVGEGAMTIAFVHRYLA